jgi:hypothetical protein
MSRDGTICPGTEQHVQGRNDVSRDGTICPGTERGTERYARGRNEGRNGTEWNETERGAERNDNIEKR